MIIMPMIFAHTVEYVVSMAQSNAFRNDIPFIKDLGVEFLSAENGRAVGRSRSRPAPFEQLGSGFRPRRRP